MPRGPQILSPQQRQMLEAARAAFLAFSAAEKQAQADYDAFMAQRTHKQRVALARAVSTAITSGVPKARVNVEALGTSNPNAWKTWTTLAQAYTLPEVAEQPASEPLPIMYQEEDLPAPPVIVGSPTDWPLPAALAAHEHARHLSFVGDPRERRLSVTWPGYASTAPDAPGTLRGVVVYDPATPSKWRAEMDPQDRPTEFGVETGAFTFEAEQRRGTVPLREALASYVAAAELPPYEAPGFDTDDEEEDDGF